MRSFKTMSLLVLAGATLAVMPVRARASSHREAPLVTTMPKTDGTDFYMFNSYETGRAGFVTIIANYQPGENPSDGPNYYEMNDQAQYAINLDTDGDALPEVSFVFSFTNTQQNLTIPVNNQNIPIPLVLIGPISAGDSSKSNVVETYTVQMFNITGKLGKKKRNEGFLSDASSGSTVFTKPTDNIGNKTFGSPAAYETYADQYIYNVNIPGCSTPGKLFVGQRKDPFVVNLGETFDLVNIANPVGAPDQASDALAGKNVTSIEMEVSASCFPSTASQPIIGGWTTASVPASIKFNPTPKNGKPIESGSKKFVQVSRLGMPLVNELVIGLKDKDRFNSSEPKDDGQFANYVENPSFPAIIQALFPQVTAPTLFPRADLVAVFLTGLTGVNQPPNVVPSEMLRLNTSTPVTVAASQNRLGALGGDLAGFPNGRRPGDDVVDITLQVAMGALIQAGTFGFGTPSQAPSGGLPFTDGALVNSSFFNNAFPYLKTPLPGSPNGPVPDNNGLPANGAPSGN
ncbi:MAG: DUF4331 domain-containing protein [Candidatus Binataceae bacterium]|nr:DUF4331 domain-containing protein [Candidatus Binataceae bacterium]